MNYHKNKFIVFCQLFLCLNILNIPGFGQDSFKLQKDYVMQKFEYDSLTNFGIRVNSYNDGTISGYTGKLSKNNVVEDEVPFDGLRPGGSFFEKLENDTIRYTYIKKVIDDEHVRFERRNISIDYATFDGYKKLIVPIREGFLYDDLHLVFGIWSIDTTRALCGKVLYKDKILVDSSKIIKPGIVCTFDKYVLVYSEGFPDNKAHFEIDYNPNYKK